MAAGLGGGAVTDLDETAVRDALKAAYREHADADTNAYELFAYATDVPADADDDTVLSLAEAVLADPPEGEVTENTADPADGEDRRVTAEVTSVTDDFADHYDHVGDVYAELGSLDDGGMSIGNTDFVGWYHTSPPDTDDFDGRGRPWALGREFPGMRDDLDRVVYTTISYAPKAWYLDAWTPYQYGDDGREWIGETPTPNYDELVAYAPFADIDLDDDVKHDRPAGDIPREQVEDALALYIDAFADLAGGREHVFALDSVGGAYVMVAPTSTAPIAERYEPDGRRRLFSDLTDRMNEWLDEQREAVNDAVDVGDFFAPDLLNNKNRLYKAPMSVHSSLDGVVTPVDTSNVTYEYTPVEAVTDAERDAAAEWAGEFTGDHTDAVDAVVAGLWPDYYADADGWGDALDDRLADLRSAEVEHEANQRQIDDVEVPDDLETTDDIDVIYAAIDDIHVANLAADIAEVTGSTKTDDSSDAIRFDPPWRTSDSGTSCYADRKKFVDLKEGKKGGGALKLVARDRGIINRCGANAPDGEKFWKAVGALREEGEDIPRFTGGRGVHPDRLGLYERGSGDEEQRRKALRVLRASRRD